MTETEGIIKIGDTAGNAASGTAASGAAAEPRGGEALIKPFKIRKRIGSTTYDVEVFFSPGSRETLNEKIMRLIRNEALKNGGETS